LVSPIVAEAPAILAVDDHPSNLLALEAVLEPLGYRVVQAKSGAEALKKLAEHDFVLILMDVHMPGLDGYQTTALIRQRERSRDVPVIFLTAVYNQPEHTYRGYALGAVDYLSKPFDPETLRGKVKALVMLYTRGQRAERERAQAQERIKDLFLGAVGHDLRNPLNAILLASHAILRSEECGNAHHRAHAKRIERASHRMQRMIEDILDLTRGQFAEGIPVARRETNVGDVCRAVVDELRLARPDRIVELDVGGDVGGIFDPDRLGRVVSNLLGNAVEHGEGGPIRIRVRGDEASLVLEVHNGGAPIDPNIVGSIFEPFRGGDRSSGLGLGLYIVREIVRAHLGAVDVRSTLEEGTTFTVTLPKLGPPESGGD
jgi:signal transduction histidine kinase